MLMMNQILQGWKRMLQDYRHWKLIIKYPYCDFDCAVFFGNLAEPPNSLDDYIEEMKQLDAEMSYDNLWELYDDIEQHIDETNKLLEEVDGALK